MKHMTTALCSLLAISSIHSMEKKSIVKEITIYNKNVTDDVDCKGINIDFQRIDSEGYGRGMFMNACQVECRQTKTISLYDDLVHFVLVPIIRMRASAPRQIKLLVTEDGPLKFGDTLTIAEDQEEISISISRQTGQQFLSKASKLVKIGSSPDNFPRQTQMPQQILTIRNINLAQVTIWHAALRKSTPYVYYTPPACTRDADQELRTNDDLFEQIQYHLRKGEERMLITFSSDNNSSMVATLTKLLLPQALQDVEVRINDGDIKSGDTLEISYSEEDNERISITNQHGKILAKLYTVNSILTFG